MMRLSFGKLELICILVMPLVAGLVIPAFFDTSMGCNSHSYLTVFLEDVLWKPRTFWQAGYLDRYRSGRLDMDFVASYDFYPS
jgi:hypothetical protein